MNRKINKKILVGTGLLLLSLIIVSYCSWIYLINNTYFIENIQNLIGGKNQLLKQVNLWVLGVILFGISFLFLKNFNDVWKVFWFFIWEFLLFIATILLLLSIFIDSYYERFRILLFLSGLTIYYSVYHAKRIFNKIEMQDILNIFSIKRKWHFLD